MSLANQVMFFVLAGGDGTRFKSVDSSVPKVIAILQGKSVIEYTYDALPQELKQRFVVCTGVDAFTAKSTLLTQSQR